MPRSRIAAFTLVEMLVSVAVLVLLVVLVMQLFNSATATATLSRKHLDADEAARQVFDRMGNDFTTMVRRQDVNYIFYKNTGTPGGAGSNDAMFFCSEAPGYLDPGYAGNASTSGSAGTMAIVGYRINTNTLPFPGIPVMERLGESLTWGGMPDASGTVNPGGMEFLPATLASTWSYTLGIPPYTPSNNQYDTSHFQVLSDLVFRMEFCFLLKSSTYALSGTSAVTNTTGYSNAPTDLPSATAPNRFISKNYFAGSAVPDLAGNVYGFPSDLGGLVVTIAVLDGASRKQLGANALSGLGAALQDSLSGDTSVNPVKVQANPTLTAQVWRAQLLGQGYPQPAGIGKAALQQVCIYERTFYLDAN